MNKEIIKLIKDRLEKGKREYEEELNPFDGRDWIDETLEEVADALVYIIHSYLFRSYSRW